MTAAAITEPPKPKRRRSRDRWRATGWTFAAPGLSMIAIGVGFPLVYAVVLSVSTFTLLHPRLKPFVGLENFRIVLADPYFWHSVVVTFGYSGVTVLGEFVLGLGIALLLNRVVRLKAIYFAILTVPVAISPVSAGLIWQMLLQPDLGIIDRLLQAAGIGGVDWLGSPGLAFWTFAFVNIWQQVSVVVLILAAGLAALPRAPYEAAAVDGASPSRQFWYLTLPMLRPVAAIAILIQLINEARTYDLIYVLNREGLSTTADLVSYFATRQAFLGLSVGEGAAVSFALVLIVLLLTGIFFRLVTRQNPAKPGNFI